MKRLTLMAALSLLSALLLACSPAVVTPPPVEATTITVLDDMDREITLSRNPQRIVSLAPSTTEILFAIGVQERVVGVTSICVYPPEAQNIPNIGDYFEPSVETIISMNPDVVFADGLHKETVEQLDALDIPAVVLYPQTIADIFDNIRLVGETVGADDEAEAVVAEIMGTFDEVAEKLSVIKDEDRPVVFWEVWSDPIWTAAKWNTINELIEMAGGINMAGDVDATYIEYSFEMLLIKDPEVIFYGHAVETVE